MLSPRRTRSTVAAAFCWSCLTPILSMCGKVARGEVDRQSGPPGERAPCRAVLWTARRDAATCRAPSRSSAPSPYRCVRANFATTLTDTALRTAREKRSAARQQLAWELVKVEAGGIEPPSERSRGSELTWSGVVRSCSRSMSLVVFSP
jgi:hypothetical protein